MYSSTLSFMLSIKPPSSPPPAGTPEYCPFLSGTGKDFILQHLGYHTYLWATTGHSFWAYPLAVKDEKLIAYAWDGEEWQLIKMELTTIDSIY